MYWVPALYGTFVVKGGHIIVFTFILLFDPRREHSSVPTAVPLAVARGGGQGWRDSATRRVVLDRPEHGGKLGLSGHGAMHDPRGACDGRATRRGPHLYSVDLEDPDHEAGMRFACKAPRRRVHSNLGI